MLCLSGYPDALAGGVTPVDRSPSYNDWGYPGLMQMPSGRMFEDGELGITTSDVAPYLRGTIALTAMPWLMASFRYSDVQNQLYGPVSLSGSQTYKDKSIDTKIRLLEEGIWNPAMALEIRDISGGGLFSSEFLVASRRYYDLDFTLGMAWGNAGTRGNVPNPFGVFFKSFNTRLGPGSAAAGSIQYTDYFHGPAALFGGVEYVTPINGLRLKLEYDGNSYQSEAFGRNYPVRTPLNIGADYAVLPWLGIGAALERGNTAMLKMVLHANFNKDHGVPQTDSPPLPVTMRPPTETLVATTAPLAPNPGKGNPFRNLGGSDRDAGSEAGERVSGSLKDRYGMVALGKISDVHARYRVDASKPLPPPQELSQIALATARRSPSQSVQTVSFIASRDGRDVAEIKFDVASLERSVLLTGDAYTLNEETVRWTSLFGASASQWSVAPASGNPSHAASFLTPPPLPPPPPQVSEDERQRIAKAIFAELDSQHLHGNSLTLDGRRADLSITQGKYRNFATAIGRIARIAARNLPPQIEMINITIVDANLPVLQVSLLRTDIERMANNAGSPAETWQHVNFASPPRVDEKLAAYNPTVYPNVQWGLAPHLRQQIGGPNNFYFYQIYAQADSTVVLAPGLSVSGALGQNLTNNFAALTYASNSLLPHVRSDIKDYIKNHPTWMENLYTNYSSRLTDNVYGQVTVGYLELMYAGVAGEVLYRPHDSLWAVGGELNRVKQRAFNGHFAFKDYQTTTGDVSIYREFMKSHVTVILRMGRYLAGDVGATLEVQREFESGIRMGAFATKTNVSAAQFGEGSFDKGFSISIPLDMFTGEPTRSRGYLTYHPLTRDGGQMVATPSLYEMVRETSDHTVGREWWGADK
ncbi:MAG: YjbH domain-containing protein [Alphaproteobacteria bacterium]|nr:YjbH domain-containing protein [Alphaproteobacteria bacterium]